MSLDLNAHMKMQKSLSSLVTFACAAATAGAASLLSLGDNAQLHFVGDVALVYEDNVFLDSREESDFHFEFSPGLELRINSEGAASTVLRYQHRFTFYDEFNGLDHDFSDLSFQTNYNSGVVLFNAHASYKEDFSRTFDLDASSDVFETLILRDTLQAGASMKYDLSELTALKVAVDYSENNFEDLVLGDVTIPYTDYDTISVPVTFFYKVKPKVNLTAGARYRMTDTSLAEEYDDLYVFVGAVGELFSPVIYADLTVGYQQRDGKGGSATDSDSASYDLKFIYTGNPKASMWAGISRDYRTSAYNARAYAFSSAAVGANYSINKVFGINGSLVYGESEYEEDVRAEDITMLRFGASYRPNDYVTVNASYSYREVDGNRADYTDGEFRVTASLRY